MLLAHEEMTSEVSSREQDRVSLERSVILLFIFSFPLALQQLNRVDVNVSPLLSRCVQKAYKMIAAALDGSR
jgi:hypothetical protein